MKFLENQYIVTAPIIVAAGGGEGCPRETEADATKRW